MSHPYLLSQANTYMLQEMYDLQGLQAAALKSLSNSNLPLTSSSLSTAVPFGDKKVASSFEGGHLKK